MNREETLLAQAQFTRIEFQLDDTEETTPRL